MNGGKTYLKQYNENTAIRACTNLIKTCHGSRIKRGVLAPLSGHFTLKLRAKRAARYIITAVAEMYVETRISMSLGCIIRKAPIESGTKRLCASRA